MKRIISFMLGAMVLCLFTVNSQAQKLVEDVKISSDQATLEMTDQSPQSYLLEIGGPDNYYWKNEINDVKSISLSNLNAQGEKFADGTYKLQVTPTLRLTDQQRTDLQEIRNDEKAMMAYRQENNLPTQVAVYNINFAIRNGKFVTPDQKEAKIAIPGITSAWAKDHPSLYASLSPIELDFSKPILTSDNRTYATDNSGMSEDDQVFIDDVIISGGSLCVGFDCVNGESFGSDTQRLKENNLRIHFDDTSNSASFPSNDWRITINDSTNGGANFFSIDDATAGTVPFRIEAGAGNNALHVDASGGNIGMGTNNPVVELHVKDGDSPTYRLEQDGSSGFGAQTWDIAGNETNFFVRDVTNGSKLPFKIKPGAPDNALFVAANANIGLSAGTNPTASLHVRRTDGTAQLLVEEASSTTSQRLLLSLKNNGAVRMNFENTSATPAQYIMGVINSGNFTVTRAGVSGSAIVIDDLNRVGINAPAPGFELEVNGDAAKTGGGIWATASDRKLKTNIEDYTDGLDQLLQIRPVRYEFNGKQGLVTDKKFIGIIAQEMQQVAPYMINPAVYTDEDGNKSNYLTYDGSALTYMLINSVKTQNDKIEQQAQQIRDLQAQLSKVDQLEQQVAELAELIKQNADHSTETSESSEK